MAILIQIGLRVGLISYLETSIRGHRGPPNPKPRLVKAQKESHLRHSSLINFDFVTVSKGAWKNGKNMFHFYIYLSVNL